MINHGLWPHFNKRFLTPFAMPFPRHLCSPSPMSPAPFPSWPTLPSLLLEQSFFRMTPMATDTPALTSLKHSSLLRYLWSGTSCTKRVEYWPPIWSPNPWSSLGLTWCHLVSTLVIHSPLIGPEWLCKFGTTRLETQVQHTSWSQSPAVTKPCSQSFRSWQPLLLLSLFPFLLSTLGWVVVGGNSVSDTYPIWSPLLHNRTIHI